MSETTNVNKYVRNILTKAQYDSIAEKDPNQDYFVTDEDLAVLVTEQTLSDDAKAQARSNIDTYSTGEVDSKVNGITTTTFKVIEW